MTKRSFEKKPLYRRMNRTTHGVHRNAGGEHRWHRNSKAETREVADEVKNRGMKSVQAGLDFTPLFKFLLSKVGEDFESVYREAVSRLPDGNRHWARDEPVFWMVAKGDDDRRPVVGLGESSFFSGLYVDAAGRLAKVAPEIGPGDIFPVCPCCTHTFNGIPVPNAFDPDRVDRRVAELTRFQ